MLLQTPSRGRLSAKLSVFRGPGEEDEPEKEKDERQLSGHNKDVHSLNEHARLPLVPTTIQQAAY